MGDDEEDNFPPGAVTSAEQISLGVATDQDMQIATTYFLGDTNPESAVEPEAVASTLAVWLTGHLSDDVSNHLIDQLALMMGRATLAPIGAPEVQP